MTHSEQEEILRRALHAVADTIEPAADGLERIRARLSRPRPLAVAWAIAAWTSTVQALQLRLEPAAEGQPGRLGSWLRLLARSLEAVGERLRPAVEALLGAARALRPGSGMSRHEKLRSALAFGAAAVIGAAGGFALSAGLPQQVISAALSTSSGQAHHPAGGGNNPGASNGNGQKLPSAPGTAPGSTRKPSPTPTASCRQPTPGASASPYPSATGPSTTPPSTSPPTSTPPTTTPPTTPTTSPPPSTGTPTPTQSQSPGGVGPSTAPNNSSDGGVTVASAPSPVPITTESSPGATNQPVQPAASASTTPGAKHTSSSGPCS
jgi:hypothetical protein